MIKLYTKSDKQVTVLSNANFHKQELTVDAKELVYISEELHL